MSEGTDDSLRAAMLGAPRAPWTPDGSLGAMLVTAADLGAVDLVRTLVGSMHRDLGASRSLFWIATAEQRAGDVVSARDTLGTAFSYASDAQTRAAIEARMMYPLKACTLDPPSRRVLDELSARVDLRRPPLTLASAPVTAALSLSIVALSGTLLALDRARPDDLARLGGWSVPLGRPWHALHAVSYGFLHASAAHLAVNLATLAALGVLLEHRLGSRRFALLYALSAIGAALYALGLSAPGTVIVGASGSLFGLVGAALAHFAIDPVLRATPEGRGVLLALVAAPLAQLGPWAMSAGVSTPAHLGGFATGLLFGLLARPRA